MKVNTEILAGSCSNMVNASKKYHLGGPTGFVLVMAILLAACAPLPAASPTSAPTAEPTAALTKLASPTAKPTAVQTILASPTTTCTDSEVDQMSVCHVFIAEYGEQLGGMPALLEVTYVAQDGIVQQTRESTDDTILSLREGKADVSDILQGLGSFEFPAPPEEEVQPGEEGVVLPEYAGPTLLIEVAFCDAPTRQWMGSPEDVPPVLAEMVRSAKTLGQTVLVQSTRPGQRYIRAQVLKPEPVEQLRRAGLVIDINREQLESSPLLESVITHERRLIGVPSEEALYGSVPLSFTHGRSAHISYDEQVFQIRHLLTVEP